MSSAAVSLATTQPLSSRPSTSGRKPCGSRAAYSVCSSMKTSEYAPLTSGRTVAAAVSTTLAAGSAGSSAGPVPSPLSAARSLTNSAVSTSVSDVATMLPRPGLSAARPPSSPASSRVLIRFPLCPSARLVFPVERKVGCAFAQTEAPVVEYRQ